MEKKVSLKDVARHVGVSTALVSYVMSGKEKQGRVGDDMVKKIRKAAAKLHYQPNLIAKSLKSGKTNTIGLIVADISNPFFSNIARIIEDEAQKIGYVVIFGSSDESKKKQEDLITVFLNRQVDAFIIAPTQDTESQIRQLKKNRVPVVLIDRFFAQVPADSVHIDNRQASFTAVQHLIDNGRKKIAMVTYDTSLLHMEQRGEGYKEALNTNGIRFKKEWLAEISYKNLTIDIHKKLSALLQPLQVDAILFATNSLAVAGLKKISELGVQIPEDLAIISFDESEVFDFFYSPVTYVSQSVSDIGREAVFLAEERMNNPRKRVSEKTIRAALIVRESCGGFRKQQ